MARWGRKVGRHAELACRHSIGSSDRVCLGVIYMHVYGVVFKNVFLSTVSSTLQVRKYKETRYFRCATLVVPVAAYPLSVLFQVEQSLGEARASAQRRELAADRQRGGPGCASRCARLDVGAASPRNPPDKIAIEGG